MLRVTAQQTTVECSSEYNWMENTMNQNPCLVAAYLLSVCSGGSYTVSSLSPSTHYVGPWVGQGNPCECSTATYCLLSACSICQNATYINWSSWSFNCSTVYTGYPESIPNGTAIPEWAYQEVIATDNLDLGTAPPPSFTPTTIPILHTPSSTPSATAQSPSKSGNTGAIIGGAVGGVVGLAAIAALAVRLFLHRRQQKTPPDARGDGTVPAVTNSMHMVNSDPYTAAVAQPKPYDPSDPSTFPTSLPLSTVQTRPNSNNYQNPPFYFNLYTSEGRPGAYDGVPEL
ncbi:hypothetical protein M404DRAFT_501237 [Pisolithus tinctorius Marx 270]|uniref:Uncharacterized protein n=1 Tax=Pisolithus tinctorius Marx 270 TaxID=870435 RepID=A0A0C3MXB8_PISTI|nr:hypothetical protein M404DRAFT_501237 [Pisolithus tinctorius Marx 270]